MLAELLQSVGLKPGTKGVEHNEVELFPKQDSVAADGVGSMFILPFANKSVALDAQGVPTDTIPPLIHSEPIIKREHPVIERNTTPALETVELKRLQQALNAISNEGGALDYDSWRDIIFAIHHASGGSAEGQQLALEFSRRSSKHDEEFFNNRVWPYIRSEREGPVITAASIFAKARENGFNESLSMFDDISSETPEPAKPLPDKTPRFHILDPVEFISRPEPKWIIWRVLPAAELAIIYGESTSGKSFVAFDMACAVVRGIDWRDQPTERGRVVYVCAEGAGDFQLRVEAYCKANMLAPEDLKQQGLGILPEAPNLYLVDDVKALIESLRAFGTPAVIFIDTLARTSAGANENSAEDMNKVLANCQAIYKATGALVVLIHHAGKDLSKEIRGSSAIKAAADAVIDVNKMTEEMRAVHISKLKGGRDGGHYPFALSIVPLREGEHGVSIDSCVIAHMPDAPHSIKRKKLTGHKALAWETILNRIRLGHEVTTDEVVAEAVRRLTPKPDKRGQDRRPDRIREALDTLARDKYVTVLDGVVKLVEGQPEPVVELGPEVGDLL
jgi:hypothetical protein